MKRPGPPPAAAPQPADDGMASMSTSALLTEVARRFRVRFGRVEVVFHDGCPSPRVVVEHRLHRAVDDSAR